MSYKNLSIMAIKQDFTYQEMQTARNNISAVCSADLGSYTYDKATIDTKIGSIGSFVVLSSGQFDAETGKPTISNPSKKVIYLTKTSTTATDPYMEWIYTTDFECIGENSFYAYDNNAGTKTTLDSLGIIRPKVGKPYLQETYTIDDTTTTLNYGLYNLDATGLLYNTSMGTIAITRPKTEGNYCLQFNSDTEEATYVEAFNPKFEYTVYDKSPYETTSPISAFTLINNSIQHNSLTLQMSLATKSGQSKTYNILNGLSTLSGLVYWNGDDFSCNDDYSPLIRSNIAFTQESTSGSTTTWVSSTIDLPSTSSASKGMLQYTIYVNSTSSSWTGTETWDVTLNGSNWTTGLRGNFSSYICSVTKGTGVVFRVKCPSYCSAPKISYVLFMKYV